MKRILTLLFIFLSSICLAQQGWYFLNPTPTGNAIIDIKMLNENKGVCITTNEILRTTNGGVNWSRVHMPWVLSNISLFMVDSSTGYIVLDSGKIVKTTNGGLNWYFSGSTPNKVIKKIFFQNTSTGFALGLSPTNNYSAAIFRTTNSGTDWEEKYSCYDCTFTDMFFVSSTGYVVGEQYQFVYNSVYKTKVFKTLDNGFSWDSIPNNLYLRLNNLFFTNSFTGFIYGRVDDNTSNVRLMKTTNGGMNWNVAQNFSGFGQLYFTGNDTGYAVSNNAFIKTYNGGLNWSTSYINNLNGASVNKLSVISNQKIVAAGGTGEIIKTTNAGLNWTKYTKSILDANFVEAGFCDINTGYISGYDGKVYRTTNGCISFDTLKPTLPYSWYIYTMSVVNKNVIYGAAGDKVYKTTNAGTNWSTHNINLNNFNVLKIKFINENTGFAVSKRNLFAKTIDGGMNWSIYNILSYNENWSVDFYNENIGIAGGVMLVRTSNGGVTWDTLRNVSNGTFIKYINRDTVFIAAYNGVYKSTNGGNSWSFTSLPGITYCHMEFPSAHIGYISGYSVMYKTTNQGEQWFKINPGIGSIAGFSMVDSVTGYSVGNYRGILKTTDGGGAPSSIPQFPVNIPQTFSLYQNYPNPFNPSTKIKFDLPKNENVKIIIFDILGRKLETLLDENLTAGVHEVNWNASRYAAGVYFYMLLTDGTKETKKMILIK